MGVKGLHLSLSQPLPQAQLIFSPIEKDAGIHNAI